MFHSRNDSLSIVRKLWRHPTQGFHKVVRLPPCQAHVQNATFFKPYQETFPKGKWSSNHSFSSAMLSWPPKFASLEPASARLRLAILQWRCGLRKPKEPLNQKSRCHAHAKAWKNRCYMNEFAISWFCWCDRSRQLWVFAAPSQKYPPRVPDPSHRRNVFQSPCAVWNDIHFFFCSCPSQNIVHHLPVKKNVPGLLRKAFVTCPRCQRCMLPQAGHVPNRSTCQHQRPHFKTSSSDIETHWGACRENEI